MRVFTSLESKPHLFDLHDGPLDGFPLVEDREPRDGARMIWRFGARLDVFLAVYRYTESRWRFDGWTDPSELEEQEVDQEVVDEVAEVRSTPLPLMRPVGATTACPVPAAPTVVLRPADPIVVNPAVREASRPVPRKITAESIGPVIEKRAASTEAIVTPPPPQIRPLPWRQ